MSQQSNVLDRYSEGAKKREEALCCPVNYDQNLLKMLPNEIIEKDYGCGDPSSYVQKGDTVLDLGSGGGKICYMAAQLVGNEGQVIGVDMNDDMLELANRHRAEMAEKLGSDRVRFYKGYIQDLALDLSILEGYLLENPVKDSQGLAELEAFKAQQKKKSPLIDDNSVNLVISNCVLNLVDQALKPMLIAEIFRVLKPGGRIAISDIISDQAIPEHLQQDAELWSGCISGAFEEQAFIDAFVDAGFVAVGYDKWESEPWQVVEDIEFRSVTITAIKPVEENDDEVTKEVIFIGPYQLVVDEEGREYWRGERTEVTGVKQRQLLSGLYKGHFVSADQSESPSTSCCSPEPQKSAGCCS
jgi:ubiquinone/menaquinone biosynthesis C-methylase UbiE